jgi:hypothetical protein
MQGASVEGVPRGVSHGYVDRGYSDETSAAHEKCKGCQG